MEEILMAIFKNDGGYADWITIAKTEYDWKDIIKATLKTQTKFGFLEELKINYFYKTILEFSKRDLKKAIKALLADTKIENINDINILKEFYINFEEYWTIKTNFLDSHIMFNYKKEYSDKIIDLLTLYLRNNIEEIDRKIGFTTLNIL